MDILKFRNGYCGQEGLVYAGRPRREKYMKGQLLVGLGNPFSWKPSKYVKGRVNNLEESLAAYRTWLFKILKHYKNGEALRLEMWERDYVMKVLALSKAIAEGKVKGLVCWCTEKKNYIPKKGLDDKQCHTQILYAACLWVIENKVLRPVPIVHLGTWKPIDIFDLW
jgi:hypothetical protein